MDGAAPGMEELASSLSVSLSVFFMMTLCDQVLKVVGVGCKPAVSLDFQILVCVSPLVSVSRIAVIAKNASVP